MNPTTVDELRLVVAPVVVGSGRRLFPPDGAPWGQQGTYDRREV